MTDNELYKLAKAAPPGPWKQNVNDRFIDASDGAVIGLLEDDTAAYVAAVDPQTIIRLLVRVTAAERRVLACEQLIENNVESRPNDLAGIMIYELKQALK